MYENVASLTELNITITRVHNLSRGRSPPVFMRLLYVLYDTGKTRSMNDVYLSTVIRAVHGYTPMDHDNIVSGGRPKLQFTVTVLGYTIYIVCCLGDAMTVVNHRAQHTHIYMIPTRILCILAARA